MNFVRPSLVALATVTTLLAACDRTTPGSSAQAPQAATPASSQVSAEDKATSAALAASAAVAAQEMSKPRPATYDPNLVPAKNGKPVVINLGGK